MGKGQGEGKGEGKERGNEKMGKVKNGERRCMELYAPLYSCVYNQ